jgi:hypothetical protein
MTMIDDLIQMTTNNKDGWALEAAHVYGECGHIGSDLIQYLDFWYGDRDDLPTPSLGSLNYFEELTK